MRKSILQMSKKEVEIERIKLINQGLLSDSSYYLDLLLEKAEKLQGGHNNG